MRLIEQLPLVGISGICNLVAAIKTAKYYEMNGRDVIFLPLTDSMQLYGSRSKSSAKCMGVYRDRRSQASSSRYLEGIVTDNLRELNYQDRKQLHNFKYFTWVEQQQRSADDLRKLWDAGFLGPQTFAQADEWDRADRGIQQAGAAFVMRTEAA